MNDNKVRVLLFGLGAIGGFYAFILSRSEDIQLNVVARSNCDSVKTTGLKIKSENHGEHVVKFANVYKSPSEAKQNFDFIVCAHKAIHPASFPPLFRDVSDDKTTFIILQNGVGNEDPFRKMYPTNTIISCVVWVGATQHEPGVITHTKAEYTELGLFPNPRCLPELEKQRLDIFTRLLHTGGTKFAVEDNIQIRRWEKVVWNAAWNPLTTLTMVDTHTWLASSPESMLMTRRLMSEVISVAQRCNVPLEDDLVDTLLKRILDMAPIYSSMHTDMKACNPLEVDVILGIPLEKARELGMDVPVLTAVYALTTAVDQRLRQSRLRRI